MNKIIILGICFLISSLMLTGCVTEQQEGFQYRGVHTWVSTFLPDINYGFNQQDADIMNDWGANCISISITWAGLDHSDYSNGFEPDEQVIGNWQTGEGYSELSLERLHSYVDMAESNGLKTILVAQPISEHAHDSTTDWAQKYGSDFITFNTQPGNTPIPGLDRFCNFLKFITKEFPNSAIVPWHFPYHKDANSVTDEVKEEFYSVTLPTMLEAIRKVDPDRDVFLYPLQQGLGYVDGKHTPTAGYNDIPYIEGDEHVYYGMNSHDGYINVPEGSRWGHIARVGEQWSYDMEEFNRQWQPAVDFKEKHPKAKLVCTEWIGIAVQPDNPICETCGDRPIDQTRLDWSNAMFEKAEELEMSWTYWGYLHCPMGPNIAENPFNKEDCSESEIAELIDEWL